MIEVTEKCVTFQSEVKYNALFKAVKEVMSVTQLLKSMNILVKYTVMANVDNVGAILMASNITTMSCNRHMDIR